MRRKQVTLAGLTLIMGIALHACFPEDPEFRSTDSFVGSERQRQPLTDDVVNFTSQEIPGKYIVVFNTQEIGGSAASQVGNDHARAKDLILGKAVALLHIPGERITEVYGLSINGFAAQLSNAEVDALRNDIRVQHIEADRIVTLSPPPGKGWNRGDNNTGGQVTPYGINRVGGAINYTGSNVAWIIDTGIDLTHPDLNVQSSRGFTAFKTGIDASLSDGHGHGTHVAGTVAAINNGIGVVGVAAGAVVIPVKVLGSNGSGSFSGVIAGVDYVAAHGTQGDVANMSLGGSSSKALDDAVSAAASKGIRFALAAGNSGNDAGNYSPARVNGTNIYTISAMNSSDQWAYFSNWGNPPVDYCAPGVSVRSTWKGGTYNTISGTSMATPHAAGVLLLGGITASGFVKSDPDGKPDPVIAHNQVAVP